MSRSPIEYQEQSRDDSSGRCTESPVDVCHSPSRWSPCRDRSPLERRSPSRPYPESTEPHPHLPPWTHPADMEQDARRSRERRQVGGGEPGNGLSPRAVLPATGAPLSADTFRRQNNTHNSHNCEKDNTKAPVNPIPQTKPSFMISDILGSSNSHRHHLPPPLLLGSLGFAKSPNSAFTTTFGSHGGPKPDMMGYSSDEDVDDDDDESKSFSGSSRLNKSGTCIVSCLSLQNSPLNSK